MKYKKLEINKENWNVIHDLEKHIPFYFSCKNPSHQKITKPLNLQIHPGIEIGEFSETMSLPEKAVMHKLMDIEGYSIETKTIIPFGSEPAITRKFEYLPNIVKITTDVEIKKSITAENFEVDSLKLEGNWKKCAVINLSADNHALKKIDWIDLHSPSHACTDSQTHGLIYDSPSHFHIFLLETQDGTRLEIGAGFDLWRWNAGGREEVRDEDSEESKKYNSTANPQGRFTIEQTAEGLFIKRQIITSDKEFEIDAKNWRFNWYLAWKTEKKKSGVRDQEGEKQNSENSAHSNPIPLSPEYQESKIKHVPCFHAKNTRNQLRKSVRSVINKLDDDILHLDNIAPHICTNSSHISRPGEKDIEHWDMTDIIDFWLWTNRQLQKKESCFIITPPKNSIFEELPSFCSLRERCEM